MPPKKQPPAKATKKTQSPAQDPDLSPEADNVRVFMAELECLQCVSCGHKLITTQDLEKMLPRQFTAQIAMSKRTPTSLSALTTAEEDATDLAGRFDLRLVCPKCKDSCTCVGCGERVNQTRHGVQGDGIAFSWHCDRARLSLIWFLLCGYDNQVRHNKPLSIAPKEKKGKAGRWGRGGRGRGHGRGAGVPSGVGYGGDDGEDDYDESYGDEDIADMNEVVSPAQTDQPMLDLAATAASFYAKHPPHAPNFSGPGHSLGGHAAQPQPGPLPGVFNPPFSGPPYAPTANYWGVPPPASTHAGPTFASLQKLKKKVKNKIAGVHGIYPPSYGGYGGYGYMVGGPGHTLSGQPPAMPFAQPPPGFPGPPPSYNMPPNNVPHYPPGFPGGFQPHGPQHPAFGYGMPDPPFPFPTPQQAPGPPVAFNGPQQAPGPPVPFNGPQQAPSPQQPAPGDPDYNSENSDFDVFDQGEHFGGPDGYGAFYNPYARRKRAASPIREDPDDLLTTQAMSALSLLLPSFDGREATAFDFEPPAALTSMLLRSSLVDRAAELLRNDSVEDATRRGGLYESVLAFVKSLANHYTTSDVVVYAERYVNRTGHDLLRVSMGLPTRMKGEERQMAQPVAACLVGLRTQSEMIIKRAQANEQEFQTEDGLRTLWICRNVCDLAEFMQATAAQKKSQTDMPATPAADTNAWEKELAMLDVPDEAILSAHAFGGEARKLGDPPAGRMRELVKEITRLKTGLPPGIFVRYGESRMDVMKILIVGPQGTPYEYGLWEFDLLCGINYPNEPPKMTFRTTGGGQARVNPNLYNCGKICLSLLGTWSGPTWQPGKSTLLQVLVSIQAMIFCDEPHCNEPSFEHDRGSEHSKAYNRNVYVMTVKHAMLEWLGVKTSGGLMRSRRGRTLAESNEHQPPGDGIWGDVVEKHFEIKQTDILKTLDTWIADKPPPRPHRRGRNSSALGHPHGYLLSTGGGGHTLGGDGSNIFAQPPPPPPPTQGDFHFPPFTSVTYGDGTPQYSNTVMPGAFAMKEEEGVEGSGVSALFDHGHQQQQQQQQQQQGHFVPAPAPPAPPPPPAPSATATAKSAAQHKPVLKAITPRTRQAASAASVSAAAGVGSTGNGAENPTLVEKLKGALKELEKSGGSRGYAFD
ncbi:hypothetical protein B0A55_08364 [Friedmanniomyces simplex]|uniref:UBC core domain-containing protein n=1 Tax=Friedmanniomyces simplex TaxID=329884 RepID=A0A4V5NI35_9PEZI|nr:hypothetical protein B0A55_08364 [Friedmanniomyces simplex]